MGGQCGRAVRKEKVEDSDRESVRNDTIERDQSSSPSERKPSPQSSTILEFPTEFSNKTPVEQTGPTNLGDETMLPSPIRKAQSHALLWMPQFDKGSQAKFSANANGMCTHGRMMEDYVTVKLLTANHSGSCTVELCKQLSTGQDVVVKIFNRGLLEKKARRSLSRTTNAVQVMLREIAIMQKLKHPSIVHQLDMIDAADGMLYIVMEYVAGGPTMRWNEAEWKYDATESHQCDSLPINRARSYFRDAILGLEYIHAQNIVHRDIKPENLLVDREYVPGKENGEVTHVKIADFGVSCFVSAGDDQISDTQGTLLFEAPESFSGQSYSGFCSDIWALGVTLFCFLYQNVPFEADTMVGLNQCIRDTSPELPQDIDPDLADLFARILNKDASQRATIQELKSHPWVLAGLNQPRLNSPVQVKPISVTDAEVAGALSPQSPTNYIALLTKIKVQMRKLKEAAMTPKGLDGQSKGLGSMEPLELTSEHAILGSDKPSQNASSRNWFRGKTPDRPVPSPSPPLQLREESR